MVDVERTLTKAGYHAVEAEAQPSDNYTALKGFAVRKVAVTGAGVNR